MTTLILTGMVVLVLIAGGHRLHQKWILRHNPTVRTVTVTLTADTTGFVNGLRAAARAGDRLGAQMQRRSRLLWRIELLRVRVETTWRVRGGMHAALGYPDSECNAQVQAALTEPLFPTNAAVAYIRGWAENRPVPADPVLDAARALPLDPHPMYDQLVTP